MGAMALLAWKAKTLLVLVALKGKLLLAGLAKLSTLSSMMLSVGVYATAFGWKLAVGLVVSIYVHEMGHVAALIRYGVKASAPLFVPGLGAFVRLRQALGDPRQDARVGLAGPLWGAFAAAFAAAVWAGTGWPLWGGIAKLGAVLNLFNLLPFSSLDGGRAFRALNRPQRWCAVVALSVCWSLSADPLAHGFLTLLLIVGVFASLSPQPASTPDRGALLGYVVLAAALTYLSELAVPLPAQLVQGGG
jgi:Zn-dependent protease